MFNWFRRQFSDQTPKGDRAQTKPDEEKQSQTPQPAQTEAKSAADEQAETSSAQESQEALDWAKAAYKNIQQRKLQEKADLEATQAQTTVEEGSTAETQTTSEEGSTAETQTTAEETTPEATPVAETETGEEVTPPTETQTTAEETTPEATPVAETETEEEVTPPTETQATAEETTPETTPVAETETGEEVTPPTETQATAEETAPETTSVAETETEEEVTPPTETQATAEETTPASAKAVPAWMRKSSGLERLRETAIETEPETPATPVAASAKIEAGVEFDEEFIWSAQILANQGRSPEDVSEEEISWLKRLRKGLGKTRRGLINQLKSIVGKGPLNQDAVTEIEALLLQADVGIEATDYIIETLQAKLREEALPPEQAIAYLKQILRDLLDRPLQDAETTVFVPEKDTLNIWLITGVNGAGKTTTIGKLAHLANKSGYSTTIAAADTFRAAAVEQVKAWGDRSNTPVIANPGQNTDPAAVVFDAITAVQARNVELLLVDTAGRLQNKKNLMEELAKIRRIIDRKAPEAKIESLLVLDATLGQNGLRQAQVFSEAAKLSGVVLTKLDGTAKGGVALAVTQQMNLPIRFIGAGEGIEDLRPFSSYEFVEALLNG